MLRKIVTRVLFLPTLVWNVILSDVFGLRRWWHRVDELVVLGALPFPWLVGRMADEGIGAVVNTCEEYRGPVAAYRRAGIEQLHIPTPDYTPPARADLDLALAFMREHTGRGRSVYVHCKAGRGRSATVALCWLMAERGMDPESALAHLIAARPQVNRGLAVRAVVLELYRDLRLAPGAGAGGGGAADVGSGVASADTAGSGR